MFRGRTERAWLETLRGPDPEMRVEACEALGEMGPKARSAEKAIRRYLKDDDAHVRELAAEALRNVRGEPR